MHQTRYKYNKVNPWKYTFISIGSRPIEKIVEFTPSLFENGYNLGFGDATPGRVIDDVANSNNGDIIRVFATVIDIAQDFLAFNPKAILYFEGSTRKRTMLYNRIMRMHYQAISQKYSITAATISGHGFKEIPFDPTSTELYLSFLIRKIN